MRNIIKKYGHIWTVLYILIYLPWFMWLEKNITIYTPIHTKLDDVIPFCEYFIIPYFIWFLYIPAVFIFLFFKSREEYYKLSGFMFIGMSICLLICTVFPNGQELRLSVDANKNVFTKIVSVLYKTDTNTNVFPSIHVYNSIGAAIALVKTKYLKPKHIIKYGSVILSALICLSTVFLKQHSVIDVLGGIGLAFIMYTLVYKIQWNKKKCEVIK